MSTWRCGCQDRGRRVGPGEARLQGKSAAGVRPVPAAERCAALGAAPDWRDLLGGHRDRVPLLRQARAADHSAMRTDRRVRHGGWIPRRYGIEPTATDTGGWPTVWIRR